MRRTTTLSAQGCVCASKAQAAELGTFVTLELATTSQQTDTLIIPSRGQWYLLLQVCAWLIAWARIVLCCCCCLGCCRCRFSCWWCISFVRTRLVLKRRWVCTWAGNWDETVYCCRCWLWSHTHTHTLSRSAWDSHTLNELPARLNLDEGARAREITCKPQSVLICY